MTSYLENFTISLQTTSDCSNKDKNQHVEHTNTKKTLSYRQKAHSQRAMRVMKSIRALEADNDFDIDIEDDFRDSIYLTKERLAKLHSSIPDTDVDNDIDNHVHDHIGVHPHGGMNNKTIVSSLKTRSKPPLSGSTRVPAKAA